MAWIEYRFPWEPAGCRLSELEESRALRHIGHQNARILNFLEEIMSDLSSITNAVEAESNVVDGAIVLLTQLAADVEAAKNDPVAIQQIVDNISAEKDKLAAAVTANTPADSGTNPPAGAGDTPVAGDAPIAGDHPVVSDPTPPSPEGVPGEAAVNPPTDENAAQAGMTTTQNI